MSLFTNTNFTNHTNALQKAARLLNAILLSRIRNHFRHSAPEIMFFSAKRDVFALMLSVLCEQSHDGCRACVKARFRTLSHEGSMRVEGHRLHQRVFAVFVKNPFDLYDLWLF